MRRLALECCAYFFSPPAVSPVAAGGVLGLVAEESDGVVGVGVAGVAVEPESAGAGVVGVVVAGAGSDAAGGVAAGVAGASSRLLQPASTAVKTAAAKRVWRICMFCLQRLLMGCPDIRPDASLPKFDCFWIWIIPAPAAAGCQKMAHLDVSHRRQCESKGNTFLPENPYHRRL